MQQTDGAPSHHFDLKVLVGLLVLAGLVFHLTFALAGKGLSRDQHLGTAVEYAKSGIDLLHPVVLGVNANGAPYPLELPVWQAATAVFMKAFGRWLGWGNVVSLLFHVSTLWPLFHLARQMFSVRVAWWSLVFYLAQPLTFLYGGLASVDGMTATLAIWFMFCAWRMITGSGWGWWPAAVFMGILSATTKAPFFFVAGLTLFFWVLHQHRRSRQAWAQLVSTGGLSVLAFVVWNYHCQRCYALGEMLYVDPRLGKDAPILAWWFGDLAGRFQAKVWLRGAWRIASGLMGSIALLFLPLAGWFLRGSAPLRWWILAGAAAVLVFTNLILIHWHYYYIFSVPLALLGARAAEEFEPILWRTLGPGLAMRAGAVGLVAAAGLAQGLQAIHVNLYLDPHPQRCAELIRQNTAPTDKLVVWGGGWSVPLFRAERTGVSVYGFDAVTEPRQLARLKELGYTRIVLMNTSPLLAAISTASGAREFSTKNLRRELPPAIRDWPVRFESESVLILDLP